MKQEQGCVSRARKNFFVRCISTFLIVIFILSLFCVSIQFIYTYKMKNSILDASQQKFDIASQTMERYFDQMKYTFAEISTDPTFSDLIEGQCDADYNYTNVVKAIRTISYGRKQNEFIPYLNALYLITPKNNPSTIGSDRVYRRENFFSLHFHSKDYPEEFWMKEMQKDFSFQIYPPSIFNNRNNASLKNQKISPIAYKLPSNQNFMLVALFDIKSAISDLYQDTPGQFLITDDKGTVFYPHSFDDTNLAMIQKASKPVNKISGNYIYHADSEINNLNYYYMIPSSTLFASSNHLLLLTFLFFVLIIGATLIFSLWVSKKIYTVFNRIATQLQGCALSDEDNTLPSLDSSSADLISYVEQGIETLTGKNNNYANAINQKDSLLKTIFLQSRVRDIYVSIEDVEKQMNNSQSYVMVYMRVHYKEEFYENVQEEQGKSTFFLKQLIELYFSSAKDECTTFQIENDQIVSIINATSSMEHIMNLVQTAVKKLENESEYVFFTIVVSKVHDDVSELKAHFDHLAELSKYAMPIMATQVLVEGEVKQGAGHFYFTIEQMEKLSSLMQNESLEECIRNLHEILDYNVKKEVNGFDLYLLCTEIVSCAVKLLNRLFHSTPASLGISQVYAKLDHAVTVEQYQTICEQLIQKVVEYIRINKREEDYIISFILDYVENHYAEDIYLNLFAEKLNLTAAYISSYFKEKMNVNLSDYVNSFRIKKAITLIENPQNKNKDVAVMVGLQNINTFIRLFKKYTGYTPGEYKKKHFNN